MSDETGEDGPMTGPMDEPIDARPSTGGPGEEAAGWGATEPTLPRVTPTVPAPPGPSTGWPAPRPAASANWPPPDQHLSPDPAGPHPGASGWASPPAWGSAPQGWPPPPPTTPMAPPPGAFAAPPPGAPMAPPSGPVTPPTGPPPGPFAGSGGGGGWSYGYGGMWSPPPEPPRVPNGARRIAATIAVVTLVLASGAVGAIISAAVNGRSTNTPAASSPFGGGSNFGGGGGSSGANSATSAIATKVNPALVNIYTTIGSGSEAAGTGMVITPSGEVLTNNHVIADATTVRVELVATGATHSAQVLGYDLKDDIALIKINGVSNLNTVSFADASKVSIGDPVVAIGNAEGRGGTPAATSGSITALDQKVTAGDQGTQSSETLTGMIEMSAPIQPGDSGGALVNSKGQVIGMNTAAATNDSFGGQGGSSTAFAIPINRALKLAHQIEAQEDSANVHIGERGLLGVQVADLDQAQLTCPSVSANSGALLAGVVPGSPAQSAGLAQCDVIVSLGGKNVASTSDLNAAMYPYHPGDKVNVGWVDQSGSSHSAQLQLISGPPV